MSRHATVFDVLELAKECGGPSLPLPADHMLNSGAVLFPGAFDQQGCPLVLFPADRQAKLSSQLSKAEVVDFINYVLCLHNKKQEKENLLSVVADLRHASFPTIRFIAETLLLLELHRRMVHTAYIIQPNKKDALKLLLKHLAPSKSYTASFKKVHLKEISELSNYIDRSQLTPPLGGYFIYCHQSWVAFIKEIDAFVKEFLAVVQGLPSCIPTLHALSRLPLPSNFSELQHVCCTNEAKFQQLRRELGLDVLLRHCETVVEKLRFPEQEPCFQEMAGTALFTQTAFDMLQNHSRITAAVEKVELLWQQTFSKARFQLQVLQLREDALQITELINRLHQQKVQPYKLVVAKDAKTAKMIVSQFETSVHIPALVIIVALVRCADDVISTLAELLLFDDKTREPWVLDLERLKEKLYMDVHFILQTLKAISSYQCSYSKACSWYCLVLYENFLQEMLSGVTGETPPIQWQGRSGGTIPAWKLKISSFLKKNPPPDMEKLAHLAHLSRVIPDEEVQQAGKQMSQRCMTLRKLLISSGPVAVGHLQQALQWQYELLRSIPGNHSSVNCAKNGASEDLTHPAICESAKEADNILETSPIVVSGMAEDKPPHSSFDYSFDGAGSSQSESCGDMPGLEGLSRLTGTMDSARAKGFSQLQHREDNVLSVSDSEDLREEFNFGSVGNSPRGSIQIIPKVTVESPKFEIKVKRSAAYPSNPWLSLPVDHLENIYMGTITQTPTSHNRYLKSDVSLDTGPTVNTVVSRDQPLQTEVLSRSQSIELQNMSWTLHSQSWDDPELSPICNILSSTITDERDRSICTTEDVPTLLWDSYDLHDQHQDSLDSSINCSLKDWDLKELESLREVEMVLNRTDEILEKEEKVLAQETVLDNLLRSDNQHNHWPQWNCEDQLGLVSSSELTDAGFLGCGDYFVRAESDCPSEPRSTMSVNATTANADKGYCPEMATGALPKRLDLPTELGRVHVLKQLIMEENSKIHMLQHCQKPSEDLSASKLLETESQTSRSKDGERLTSLQPEKEKREIDKLEERLSKELNLKEHKARTRKVVKCCIMEKARTQTKEDQALCNELLAGSHRRSQTVHSTSLVNLQVQDASNTESVQAAIDPDIDAAPQDVVQPLVFPQQDCSSEGEASVYTEDMAVQNLGYVCKDIFDTSVKNTIICKPEASLTPQLKPDDGAFDPGGISHIPLTPQPQKTLLPVNIELSIQEAPESAEWQIPALPSVAPYCDFVQLDVQDEQLDALTENSVSCHNMVFNVKECSRNNNNNHHHLGFPQKWVLSTAATETAEEALVVAPCLLQTDLNTVDERQTVSPVNECPNQESASPLLPNQPVGREDMSDGVQCSETMRLSGPRFQSQMDIYLRTEIMNDNLRREAYIGHEAQRMRGVLSLKHPIKNGIIQNWNEMEKIWHRTFQQLCVDPDDHPVLLTEAAMNPLQNRQRMVETMFECFGVPFTYVAMQAVLALYAAGRSTGVVFDSGDGVCHSVPVFEGYCLPHAVQRFPLAGSDVTLHLKKLLQEQGVCMHTTAEMEIVREMKEKCCRVALNYEAELKQHAASCQDIHYTMPDGQIVTLSTERFRAPEILFKPELIGQDHNGMHENIFRSILSSDVDLRRYFLANIVLSGGNTLLSGLPERLQAEIRDLIPADMGESIHVTSPKDRDFSVWSGGAVLANLPSFSSAWISQAEYEEYGPQIVFRKCF
ncbi:uncharacterized protein V6R79_016695 [Siganus canaliculatus]